MLLGLSKGGFVGMGALSLPILALAMSPVRAAAILLPILIVQDVVGVWAFRKEWDRHVLGWMLPGSLIGIALGWFFAAQVSESAVLGVVGAISILFGAYRLWIDRRGAIAAPARSPGWAGTLFGIASGFTSQIAHAVGLEIVSGQRIWEQNFAGISTPWVAGEWLFLITDDARLVCLARATGKVRWIQQLRHYRNEKKRSNPITWYGPVLAGNRLVLTNSQGEIVSASADTGVIGTVIENGKSFTLPPVVANSTLYVIDQKGRISAYR
jgi:hypothetical protein